MNRKVHVRFDGGPSEKCPSGQLAGGLPYGSAQNGNGNGAGAGATVAAGGGRRADVVEEDFDVDDIPFFMKVRRPLVF